MNLLLYTLQIIFLPSKSQKGQFPNFPKLHQQLRWSSALAQPHSHICLSAPHADYHQSRNVWCVLIVRAFLYYHYYYYNTLPVYTALFVPNNAYTAACDKPHLLIALYSAINSGIDNTRMLMWWSANIIPKIPGRLLMNDAEFVRNWPCCIYVSGECTLDSIPSLARSLLV